MCGSEGVYVCTDFSFMGDGRCQTTVNIIGGYIPISCVEECIDTIINT